MDRLLSGLIHSAMRVYHDFPRADSHMPAHGRSRKERGSCDRMEQKTETTVQDCTAVSVMRMGLCLYLSFFFFFSFFRQEGKAVCKGPGFGLTAGGAAEHQGRGTAVKDMI